MGTMIKSAAAVVVCGLMLSVSACTSSGGGTMMKPGGPLEVPLGFKPTSELDVHASLPTGNPRVFVKVTDDRSDKTTIGHNVEDSAKPIDVVDTGEAPDQFVAEGISTELKKLGVTIADSADTADRILQVSLKTFSVEEGGTYKAQLLALVQVTDKTGKTLLNKSAPGESSTWGHSKEAANYQQVLSNAVVDMTSGLLSSADFSQALSVPK
jgi:hypothetical protein